MTPAMYGNCGYTGFTVPSEAKQLTATSVRRVGIAFLGLALLPLTSVAQSLTAADAIQRIQKLYSAPPPASTVDTIKAGDPSTPVTGIATTFLDTMDVLREAQRRGLNLVITHEPTFYNHLDDTAFFADDPVYREKLTFIQQHHMVVFRLHDRMHATATDEVGMALVRGLGWQNYTEAGNLFLLTIPQTTLVKLAGDIAAKLKAQTLRVAGNPDFSITHVAVLPGAAGLQKQVLALRRDDVEVLIAGEAAEWEAVEYVRDAGAQGRHKALILLGHEVSEEAGMQQCAEEVHALFPGLPVAHIPAGQPLWNPEHPPVAAASKLSAK